MRTINEQIDDVMTGRMTAEQVAAEGVHEYALKNFYPDRAAEIPAFCAIQAAVACISMPAPISAPISAPVMHACACGHMHAHPMTTPRGSACPECYDKMSE